MLKRWLMILIAHTDRQELPAGLAILGMLCELLLVESVVLKDYHDAIAHKAIDPFLQLTVMLPSMGVLLAILVSAFVLMQLLGKKQTLVRPLALACVYRGAQELSTNFAFSALFALLAAVLVLFYAISQNLDNCFCSKDFAPESNSLNKFYFTLAQLAVVALCACHLLAQITFGICSGVLFVVLLRRILQPYYSFHLQVVEVCFIGLSFTHSIIRMAFALHPPSSLIYLERNLVLASTVVMLPILFAIALFFSARKLPIDMPQINQKVLKESLVRVMQEFHCGQISKGLVVYCNRVNRYAEHQLRSQQLHPIIGQICTFNKEQWALFVYRVSIDFGKAESKDFQFLINCFYFEFYYTRSWTKCIRLLQRLKRKTMAKRWPTPENFRQKLMLAQAETILRKGFEEVKTNGYSFNEFNAVNTVILELMTLAEDYQSFWESLEVRHVNIDEAMDRTTRLLYKVEHANKMAAKLSFRSLHLENCLVEFDLMLRMDPIGAQRRAYLQEKQVQKTKLIPDLSNVIFVEISLEKGTLGEFINTGINIGKVLLPEGRSHKNMHINDLLPECLHRFHEAILEEIMYGDKPIETVTPLIKDTFCLNGGQLEKINVWTKLCLFNDQLVAIGFLKLSQNKGDLLLLYDEPTGSILETSQRISLIVEGHRNQLDFAPDTDTLDILGLNTYQPGQSVTFRSFEHGEQTFGVTCLKTIKKNKQKEDEVLRLLEFVPADARTARKTVARSSLQSTAKKYLPAQKQISLISIAHDSALPTFFKEKSKLQNKINKVLFWRVNLAVICCGLFLIMLKGAELQTQQSLQVAINNHSSMTRHFSARNLLTNRLLMEVEFVQLHRLGLYDETVTNFKHQLKGTLTDLYDIIGKLVHIRGSEPLVPMHYVPSLVGFEGSPTLLLEEATTKAQFLLQVDYDSKNSVDQHQVDTAVRFLLMNKPNLVEDNSDAIFVPVRTQIIRAVQILYWLDNAFSVIAILIASFIFVIVAMLEWSIGGLKSRTCQTLFRLGEQDLSWMWIRARTFANFLQCLTEEERSEDNYKRQIEVASSDDRLTKLYPPRGCDGLSLTQSGLIVEPTSSRLHRFLNTDRQSNSSVPRTSLLRRKSGEGSSEGLPSQPPNRVFNSPRRLGIGLILLYLAVIGGVVVLEALHLSQISIVSGKIHQITDEYEVMTDCQLAIISLYDQFFQALRNGAFNTATYQSANSDYMTCRKNMLGLASDNSGQFLQQLNLILYANMSAYVVYSNISASAEDISNLELYKNMDSLLQNQVALMASNIEQYGNATPSSVVKQLTIIEDTVHDVLSDLADLYLGEYSLNFQRGSTIVLYWEIGGLACGGVLVILLVVHLVLAKKRRQGLLDILDILKQHNFTKDPIKEEPASSQKQDIAPTLEALMLSFGRSFVEAENNLT